MKKLLATLLALCLTLPLFLSAVSALELTDAQLLLQRYYVDDLPEDVLEQDSLEAILAALDDPYTTYFSAEAYQTFLSSVHGESLVGIGLSFHNVFQNGFSILSVLPNSPAEAAGLQPGDRIVAVDGAPLSATSNLASLIHGEEGTAVTITVILQSTGETQSFTLERQSVTIPTVSYYQMDTAGIIECKSFGNTTVSRIQEALTKLEDNVSVWIMDLRSNPGGTANAAAGSAGLFIGGETMCYYRHAGDEYTYLYTTDACPDLTDKPLILLTSSYSASGSELFSAAARDHGFAIAIGQRTYGKGVAQSVFDKTNTEGMFDGDAMKITTQRFYSPHGTSNHIVGVLPTLLTSTENTSTIALLLSAPNPGLGSTQDYLELDFHIFSLYVDLNVALAEDNRAAFTELLEALPPFCTIRVGNGHGWTYRSELTAETLAWDLGLPFASRADFTDVDLKSASWLNTLAVYGLVAGYEDHTFRPDDSITRAEFCTLLANALNLPVSEQILTFSDTPSDAWFTPYVSAMSSMGFITGYEDGTFRPNDIITNQEIMAILASASSWLTLKVYSLEEELTQEEEDVYARFDSWARPAARDLAELNITLLPSHGQPNAPATRRTAAWFLYRVLEEAEIIWGAQYSQS